MSVHEYVNQVRRTESCVKVCVNVHQVRARYEKVLEEVNRYAPRYMEEMESIFDQSQDEERKRIVFLKQAFLSIHKHLDITNNERWTTVLCVCVCVLVGCKRGCKKNVLT